jgi:hypothetical protein
LTDSKSVLNVSREIYINNPFVENIMFVDETMNQPDFCMPATSLPENTELPMLALVPVWEWNEYSHSGQDEGLPFLVFGDEDGEDDEDVTEDESFDDMDDDFEDDFEDEDDDFDEDDDYEEEEDDYDYEEDVDYDDFDE